MSKEYVVSKIGICWISMKIARKKRKRKERYLKRMHRPHKKKYLKRIQRLHKKKDKTLPQPTDFFSAAKHSSATMR
jgi:hypothetical protein